MRNIERRVVVLEDKQPPNGEWRELLDRLSTPDLERLEQIVIVHDAGDWSEPSELSEDDRRILAMIDVVELEK